jgi:hypothetical protein
MELIDNFLSNDSHHCSARLAASIGTCRATGKGRHCLKGIDTVIDLFLHAHIVYTILQQIFLVDLLPSPCRQVDPPTFIRSKIQSSANEGPYTS